VVLLLIDFSKPIKLAPSIQLADPLCKRYTVVYIMLLRLLIESLFQVYFTSILPAFQRSLTVLLTIAQWTIFSLG